MSFLLLHRLKPSVSRIVHEPGFRGYFMSLKCSKPVPPPLITLNPIKPDKNHDTKDSSEQLGVRSNNSEKITVVERTLTSGATLKVTATPGQKLQQAQLIYADKGEYIGEFKGTSKKHGFGTQTYPDGGKYEGMWKNGMEWGPGKRTNSKGSILQGHFARGKIYNGEGVLELNKNIELEGVWSNGALDGHGKTVTSSGIVFTWEIKQGKPTTQGTQTFPDGTKYEGEWRDKKRHGQGKLTHSKGHVLEGRWVDGKFDEGAGAMVLPQGEILEGTWTEGKMEGRGKVNYVRQKVVYVGDFLRGEKHGLGILTFSNGNKYIGEFAHGEKHGRGKLITKGEITEGEWVQGKQVAKLAVSSLNEENESAASVGATPVLPDETEPPRPAYVGNTVDGKRHGYGTYTQDGVTYEGEWKNDQRHGKGKETSKYGTAEGEFRHGELYHGQGVLVESNKEVREGVWVEGKMNGPSVWRTLAGELVFEGTLQSGRKYGHGTFRYTKGDTYIGNFEDNQRHGVGQMTRADGSVSYYGEWAEGQRNGFGWSRTPTGRKKEGVWENDKFVRAESVPDHLRTEVVVPQAVVIPQAAVTFEKSEKYEGAMRDGKRNGHGTHVGVDGTTYTGSWKNDKRHGEGTQVSADGSSYTGSWKKDERLGQGTYTSADGATTYTGSWEHSQRHGQGTLTGLRGECTGEFRNDLIYKGSGIIVLDDGSTYEGAWALGRKHGQGVLTTLAGDKYTGTYKSGKRHGLGELVEANGHTYSGKWRDGKRHGKGRATTPQGWSEGTFRDDCLYNGKGEVISAGGVVTLQVWTKGELQAAVRR